ncbi:MAG: peptide-methionine (S)-S-oxide reductase MsrA [bacterium]
MKNDENSQQNETSIATFGGGCFWCIEAVFQRLEGVTSVYPGYSGGENPNPTYREVCSGTTGHVEVVQIKYDPGVITFKELLEVFFEVHDPTTLNRQGNDVGTQYRSVIFYHDSSQQKDAEDFIRDLELTGKFDRPIATEVEPLENFYKAEAYHQDYYNSNLHKPYCQYIIKPKIKKLEQLFQDKLD